MTEQNNGEAETRKSLAEGHGVTFPNAKEDIKWLTNILIERGYDHYWNTHTHSEKEWAEKGCPICKSQLKKGGE